MEQQQQQNQQQNFDQTSQVAGAMRPPMPNTSNVVRPPPPSSTMGRPPMPFPPGQRPPPPPAQLQGQQRPPLPPGMRPPPPPQPGQIQSAGQMRPPPPRPQMPLAAGNNLSNPVRPPFPQRPLNPSIPQSPNQNVINGYNNQPPTMPSPSLRTRPSGPPVNIPQSGPSMSPQGTLPSVPTVPAIPIIPIVSQDKVLSSEQLHAPMPSVPTVPAVPTVPVMPIVSQDQVHSSEPFQPPTHSNVPSMPERPPNQQSANPPMPVIRPPAPQIQAQMPPMPMRPPIPGQSQQSPPIPAVQSPGRPPFPMAPSQAPIRPPLGPPGQSPVRPPMPMPLSTSTPPSVQAPPVRPPIPGMTHSTAQRPPLPGQPMRPPAPTSPIVNAPPKPMIPQMPQTSVPQAPYQPMMPQAAPSQMANYPPTNPTEYPQSQPHQAQPHYQNHSQIPGQYPQTAYNAQPQGYQPGFSQQNSYNSGFAQAQGPAPQSVTSTSHNLKEFYEDCEHLIKPNIKSDYFTCSLEKIPRNSTLLGKARTPFGLTVSFYPFGDAERDRVAEVTGPIVRCRRCRTYLNPFAELIEQGSRWRCNMCFLANEFPQNYDFDQETQRTIERKDHVELNNFIYDFTNAPVEYTVRPPQPPVFFFALEVTAAAVQSGLFAASCRVIQEQLDSIPNEDGRARVALVTFDQRIQFYKITPTEPNAKVLVVADAGEPFLPAFSDLLVNLSECRTQLDTLLDQLPQMYSTPSKSSPALGPVLQTAHMLLKPIGGKIVVICASLPTQFEGALKARDDPKILGTPKESSLLQPANQFYKLFASEVVKDQICVDLFVAPPQLSLNVPIYVDLASLSCLTKYTGGKLYYYPEFGSSDAISYKFCSDLRRFLGQPHGFEAVLRIRASQGISLSAYHGSFFLRQTDLLSLPNVNPDHSFSAQASIDENLQGTVVCFQAALLHTTTRGERRIRVINFSAPITDDVKEVFTSMNVNGIAGILSKMAVEKVLANRLEDAREAVLNKCSDVIAAYKNLNGLKSNPNLLLPENMKNYPIMMHSLIKTVALRSGSNNLPDLRAYYLTLLKTLSVSEIIGLLLPRFYAIHSMESDVRMIIIRIRITVSHMFIFLFFRSV